MAVLFHGPHHAKTIKGILFEYFLGTVQIRLESIPPLRGFKAAGPERIGQIPRLVIEHVLRFHRRERLQRLLPTRAGLGHECAQISEFILGATSQEPKRGQEQ